MEQPQRSQESAFVKIPISTTQSPPPTDDDYDVWKRVRMIEIDGRFDPKK